MIKQNDLIAPLFVIPGSGKKEKISSMPGVFKFSPDQLVVEIAELEKLGITKILLFGIPKNKYPDGDEAYDNSGAIQEALRLIKKKNQTITVFTDVCLCAFTTHGHCRILKEDNSFDHKATLKVLAKIAVSHAEAGADFVAPSAVLNHQVNEIRKALDKYGYKRVKILSYSAKFESSFYWPFREACNSSPKFGSRTYQLQKNDKREALKRIAQDIKEGADIVMVKPALSYLDIICDAKRKFKSPLAAYNVSGEYSMIKSACKDDKDLEKKLVFEVLDSIKRAGAKYIISYHAKKAAQWLSEK